MRRRAIKRATVIAIVVGSLLNFINQYDAIFLAQQSVNWLKIGLTYCVPFGVSLLSGWLASQDARNQCK